MAEERKRIADALTRYFEDRPGTYRALLGYLDIDDRDGMRHGCLTFNDAVADDETRIERKAAVDV